MTYTKFEDLPIWILSRKLSVSIYEIFGKSKDFGFRDQILRASVSIMNNIAEGYERKGSKELVKFLYYSKGSAGEVKSMLYLAKDLNFITDEQFEILYKNIEDILKQLGAFIKSLV